MLLDENERAYLLTLQDSPYWKSIIQKISTFSKIPRYRFDKDEKKQITDWMYQSGRLDERESIVSLLTLAKTKIDLEK